MTIKLNKRECKTCKKTDYIFSKGECKYCANNRYRNKAIENQRTKERKLGKIKNYSIPKVSNKMQKALSIYRPIKEKYLKEHIKCEVEGCEKASTNIHHRKGRIGKLLYDVEWFMAVCSSCHPFKIHFTHTAWARKMGYLLNSKK